MCLHNKAVIVPYMIKKRCFTNGYFHLDTDGQQMTGVHDGMYYEQCLFIMTAKVQCNGNK